MNKIESELSFDYIRSSGPGGQNTNKVSTSVQLRFDIAHSPSLTQGVKQRLTALAGKRVSKEGVLIIEARRYRTQEQNRQDALSRFRALLGQAHKKSAKRLKTTPSRAQKEERLIMKKKRGAAKQSRRKTSEIE